MNDKLEAVRLLGEQMRALIGAIETPPRPELPEKVGYKWELQYTWGASSFAWVSVKDPDAKGTQDNPITDWKPGMSVLVNSWLLVDGVTYICVKTGKPEAITDTEYFEPL